MNFCMLVVLMNRSKMDYFMKLHDSNLIANWSLMFSKKF